jgi:hypothetical protein
MKSLLYDQNLRLPGWPRLLDILLTTVSRNSPAYVAMIADAVADARRTVERIESETRKR